MINSNTQLFVTHSASARISQTNWKQLCFGYLMPAGGSDLVDQVYDRLVLNKRVALKDKKGRLLIQVCDA